jgi:hypothetical protein
MTSTHNAAQHDALAKAVAYLGAVEVAKPGDHTPDGGLVMTRLYAFQAVRVARHSR